MIEVYALLLFEGFLRQAGQSVDWQQILITVLGSGGVVIAIITIAGNYFLNQQKAVNDAHLKAVDAKNAEVASRSKEDSDQAAALLETAKNIGQLATLIAGAMESGKQQAEILDALSARIAAQHVEASTERQKIMSGIAVDVMNTKADVDAHREESKDWVNRIREDIAGLRKDFKDQMEKALDILARAPSSKAHEEATGQILKAIASLDAKIDAKIQEVETRLETLPAAEPPKADGAALTGDGAPVIPPTESKPPEVTQ